MKTVAKKLYEAMFLVDSAQAASDWDGIIASIENILKKAKREIVSMRKWDERRLAYEIKGHSRGTYILCYFRANGEKIQDIERDVQLSERIMRVLILSADHMTQEDIEKNTPTLQREKHGQKVPVAQVAQKETQSAQAAVEKADSEQVVDAQEQESAEQAKELEQSAEPTAEEDAGEPEQLENAEAKDLEAVDEQGQEEADTEMSA